MYWWLQNKLRAVLCYYNGAPKDEIRQKVYDDMREYPLYQKLIAQDLEVGDHWSKWEVGCHHHLKEGGPEKLVRELLEEERRNNQGSLWQRITRR